VPTLKPLDAEGLLAAMAPCPAVVTLEEHVRTGGLGSAVAEVLAESRFRIPKRFQRMGLADAFCEHYGSQASLMAQCGLTAELAARTAQRLAGI